LEEAIKSHGAGCSADDNCAAISCCSPVVLALSPADFEKLIADDTEKWRKVIWAANIKAE